MCTQQCVVRVRSSNSGKAEYEERAGNEETSTAWISSLTVVRKSSGQLRICIDSKPLKGAFKRSHDSMPTTENVLPDLPRAKVFPVCDVSNDFGHVELDGTIQYLSNITTLWQVPLGTNAHGDKPFS